MSWHPNDLVSDQDLKDYEAAILDRFGQTDWQARRTKALEDWLSLILRGNGFDPQKLRTRYEADRVWSYTSSAFVDRSAAASNTTADDVVLATILAASTDYLYVGSATPFRGLHLRILDAVSAVASTLTVEYWADGWIELTKTDGTAKTPGVPFSGGGSITWALPSDWTVRAVNASDPLYYVRLKVSAAPTGGTAATQIGVIRPSSLRAAATFRTLMLIFQEAPTGAPGPWAEKAAFYKDEADAALQRALPIIGGEFDTADASDLIGATEAEQTSEEVSGRTPFTLERA